MKHANRALVALLIAAAMLLGGCGQAPAPAASKNEPAHVEPIGDTKISQVVLTEAAAKRLDIQTTPVREESLTRKRIVGGEILASLAAAASAAKPSTATSAPSKVWVRVPLAAGDVGKFDDRQAAMVLPLALGTSTAGVPAQLVSPPANADTSPANAALYYMVDSAKHGLIPGQRVRVELALTGSAAQQKVIPYAAIIYDLHGDTWAYTSPAPLTFVRHPISVDYIEGDLAVLTDGPPAGATVVTVGAAELFGTEFGVGH